METTKEIRENSINSHLNHGGSGDHFSPPQTEGSTAGMSQEQLDRLEPYESILSVSCEPVRHPRLQAHYSDIYQHLHRGQFSMAFM